MSVQFAGVISELLDPHMIGGDTDHIVLLNPVSEPIVWETRQIIHQNLRQYQNIIFYMDVDF